MESWPKAAGARARLSNRAATEIPSAMRMLIFGNRFSESAVCFIGRDGPGIAVVTARLKKVSSPEKTKRQTGQPGPYRPFDHQEVRVIFEAPNLTQVICEMEMPGVALHA
jgi:hypothetical protein